MSISGMSAQKRGFLFLGLILSFSIVIYIAVATLVTSGRGMDVHPGMQSVGMFFLIAGFLCIAIALFIAPRERQDGSGGAAMTAASVRGKGFLALVISEMGAVFGLVGTFTTSRLSVVLVLGIGAIAANLFWIVPQALRLIDADERAAAERPAHAG